MNFAQCPVTPGGSGLNIYPQINTSRDLLIKGRESFFFVIGRNLDPCKARKNGDCRRNGSVEKRPDIYKVKRGVKLVVYQSLPKSAFLGGNQGSAK
jgi:hypothetical protein